MSRSGLRWATLLALMGAVAAMPAGSISNPAVAQAADKDCADFKTQKRAQKFFAKHNPRQDPHRLDDDGDRIACEFNDCPCSRKWHRQHGKVKAASGRRWERYCGSQPQTGAGWYEVKANGIRCRGARSVAKHFWNSGGDHHFNGWNCDSDSLGLELSRADCKRRRHGVRQHVRFKYGA